MDRGVKPLAFVGQLSASKSLLNRLLIAKSYFPELEIVGHSTCDDVIYMKEALAKFAARTPNAEYFVGSAGTVLRFLALRLAREPGVYRLVGEHRLFERPQEELVKTLRQLGATCELGSNFLKIDSPGWRLHGDTLLVPFARSSQFATAVLMNAWDLPFDLFVSLGGQKVSEGYWRMSLRLAQALGMRIDFWDGDFRIPKGQKVTVNKFTVEPDVSSVFALAAIAAVNGTASFTDFPLESWQPDSVFIPILQTMGVPIGFLPTSDGQTSGTLKVDRAKSLNGIAFNLKNCPDLFPVLAALCAIAHGESDLFGAPHLVHKESNRLQGMVRVIQDLGREVVAKEDGVLIRGPVVEPPGPGLTINCDQDHRMAFAAAVLKAAGYKVEIQYPAVVRKSFPEFWSLLGWT